MSPEVIVNALMEFGYEVSVGLLVTLYLLGFLANAFTIARQFINAERRIRFEPMKRIGANEP